MKIYFAELQNEGTGDTLRRGLIIADGKKAAKKLAKVAFETPNTGSFITDEPKKIQVKRVKQPKSFYIETTQSLFFHTKEKVEKVKKTKIQEPEFPLDRNI